MIFRTVHIIDNHVNIPLLVSPKLPQNIRSLSNLGKEKKEKKKKDPEKVRNCKSAIPIQQQTWKFHDNGFH